MKTDVIPFKHTAATRILTFIVSLWLIMGGASIISKIAGVSYFPSPDWLEKSRQIASIVGIITAVFLTWMMMKLNRYRQPELVGIKKNLVFGFGLFFLSVMGSSAITSGGPLFWALLYGDETEFTYTIAKPDGGSQRYCRNSVELDGMPLMDNLCVASEKFRGSLAVGDRIVVSGTGTSFGLFARSVRKVE
tara:strand:- start:109 stop:681 length:573 start_codon:yes stop_codon:yes gene_type:complete